MGQKSWGLSLASRQDSLSDKSSGLQFFCLLRSRPRFPRLAPPSYVTDHLHGRYQGDDSVIVGLDETNQFWSSHHNPNRLRKPSCMKLGLGLTIMYGRGGYSGDAREILYIIVERLQLAELKELIHREDPKALSPLKTFMKILMGPKIPTSKSRRHQPYF